MKQITADAVSVPCAGGNVIQRALKVVAAEKDVRMADIVQESCLTGVHAADIRRVISFFESSAAYTQHTVTEAETA